MFWLSQYYLFSDFYPNHKFEKWICILFKNQFLHEKLQINEEKAQNWFSLPLIFSFILQIAVWFLDKKYGF